MKKKTRKIPCLSEKQCNGHLNLKRVACTLKLKDKTVSVPDVEIWECNRCGERFYPYEASKKIDLFKKYSGRFMLRLEPKLHWKLVRIARKHRRSLNQQINYLLENYLE